MVSLWLILCFFFACPQNSYDFDMVLLWSWSASFFLMKFVMAGRIFFVKKIFGHVLDISEWKKHKLFVFKK